MIEREKEKEKEKEREKEKEKEGGREKEEREEAREEYKHQIDRLTRFANDKKCDQNRKNICWQTVLCCFCFCFFVCF